MAVLSCDPASAVITHPVSFSIPSAGTVRRIPPSRARKPHLPRIFTQTMLTTANSTSTRRLPCFAPRTHFGRSTDGDATSSSAVATPLTSWIPSKMQIHHCLYFPSPTITTEVSLDAHSLRDPPPAAQIAVAVKMTRCSCGYIHDLRSSLLFDMLALISS